MKPTIHDVAKLANVSISTVSRVMNSPETVVDSKRMCVQAAIAELNYQPNAFARGLIYKKSGTLGVLIPDIQNPYYGGIIRGMEDMAQKLGYTLMICNTDRDKKKLISYLEIFNEKQIDGILFTSDSMYPDYYEIISKYKFPVILVSTHSLEYELPSVKINDEQAAYDAVKYLIKCGHKKIGMVCFSLVDTISGMPRYQGFLRALRDHGLEENNLCVEYTDFWFEEAYLAAARLFTRYPETTAVFAASDEFALGTISYLYENGIQVPEQVSVIGFDNSRISHMSIPKLTTIAQPVYEIGSRSIEKLHEMIETGSIIELREILPHELIIRNSTKKV